MGSAPGGTRQPNELSGFGFPESAVDADVCTLDKCQRNDPLATDLYCHDHGRFLPFIKAPVSLRILAVIVASLASYGSFELAAQIDSQIPVFVVYSAIFFGFVVLPLRRFTRTAVISSLIWVAASVVPVVLHGGSGRTLVVLAAAVLTGGVIVLAAYAVANALQARLPSSLTQESRVVAKVAAVPLVISIWSAVAAVALHYESSLLPGDERGIAKIMIITALISVAGGVLITFASSVVIGVRGINRYVRVVPKPRPPVWVAPSIGRPPAHSSGSRGAFDLAVETLARTVSHLAFYAASTLAVTGRITANCLVRVAYLLAYAVVVFINILIRFAVLTARWIQATVRSVALLTFHAAAIACRSIIDPVVGVLIPVSVLAGAPWLVMAAADDTRLYQLHGSLTVLRNLLIVMLATAALLLGTWVILASQHPRESFRSFEHSASISVSYGLVLLFLGGWLLGLPGLFGYGPIHVGVLTLTLTGVVVVALLVWLLIVRNSRRPPGAAPNRPPAPGTGARAWVIAVALVMIAATAADLVIFKPWANLSLARPGGLVAVTRSASSVSIRWSWPSSGPLPVGYVILQNGEAIDSVPGTTRSYRATGLDPATAYTYQVMAVRGARRSAPSAVVREATLVPPLWTAVLAGQWTVNYAGINWDGLTSSPQFSTDSWTFGPTCTPTRCPVSGEIDGAQFTATLSGSEGVYTANVEDDSYFTCSSDPEDGNLSLKIRVRGGRVARGRWEASSWSGTMNLTTSGGDCTSSTVTADIAAAR